MSETHFILPGSKESRIASDEKARGVIEAFGGDLTLSGTITDAFTRTYHSTPLDPFETSLHVAEIYLKGLYQEPEALRYLGGLSLAMFATKDICVGIAEEDETAGLKEVREALERNGDLVSFASNGRITIYFTKQLTDELAKHGWTRFDPKDIEKRVCRELGVEPGSFNYELALDRGAMFPIHPEERKATPQETFSTALKNMSRLNMN